MGLRRTTPPSAEPVSLAEAKLHLRVDHDDEDALISALISAARVDCEERLQRTLVTTGWTWTLDSFCGDGFVPRPPLVAVAGIRYFDASGAARDIPPEEYRADTSSDPGRIEPVSSWPATQDRLAAVTVEFSAGYGAPADVPAPIRQWVLLAIGDMYANRERSADRPCVPQSFADGLLDPYKVWPA